MTKNELIELLNADLANEYAHMHFYLHSAVMVRGLHREELSEFFMKQATSEMQHVKSFADMLVGLGSQTIASMPSPFPVHLTCAKAILQHALEMEETVVANYVKRIEQASRIGGVDGRWIEIFLEEQIMDSRKDLDNIRQMLKV